MRKKPKRPASPRARATAWSIVAIDETPLRDEVMREHHTLEDQAAAVRARIERFENADFPAYTRWEARVLGPLLTAIRDIEGDIKGKRALLEAVEDEQFYQGGSRLAAYKRVMRMLEEPEENEPFDRPNFGSVPEPGPDPDSAEFGLPPGFDADDFDLMTPAQQRAFRMEYNYMAEMYEAMTGIVAPDLDELLRASRRGRRQESRRQAESEADEPPPRRAAPSREPEAERPASRLKELYRLLVRKLHPDLNPDQPARDRELWHTVQEAYNNRDVDALEAAAARVEIGLNGQVGALPISILRRLVGDLRKALGALKSRFASVRKHPAFDFAARAPASLAKFEEKHRQRLERNLTGLKSYQADLSADLDDLAARAKKPKARRPKAPRQPAGWT